MSSETVLRWQRSRIPQTIYPHDTRKSSPGAGNLGLFSKKNEKLTLITFPTGYIELRRTETHIRTPPDIFASYHASTRNLRKPRLPQTEVLDELIRADALPVGQKLVSLPVGEHDQNLRRADTAGDRAEHLRAFRMLLDVGQRPGASKQIEREVGLRAILRPR